MIFIVGISQKSRYWTKTPGSARSSCVIVVKRRSLNLAGMFRSGPAIRIRPVLIAKGRWIRILNSVPTAADGSGVRFQYIAFLSLTSEHFIFLQHVVRKDLLSA